MKDKLVTLLRFPRHDLEDHWWHRFSKVVVIISVAACFLFSVRLANETFQPYYTFSFEKDFSSQPGTAKSIEDAEIAYDDYTFVTMAYKYSDIPEAYEYISELEERNYRSSATVDKMQQEGKLKDVLVKDLQFNYKSIYYKIGLVLTLTLFWYLFAIHIFYQTIAYVFAGSKAKL